MEYYLSSLSPAPLHRSTSPVQAVVLSLFRQHQHDGWHSADRDTSFTETELQKPDLNDRSYQVIQLGNKPETLIVTGKDNDKVSTSIAVREGEEQKAECC